MAIPEAVGTTLILGLNLAATFVFGLSFGLAAARARLDLFGLLVLAAVVGLAGGITRDLLIGGGGMLRDVLLGEVPTVLRAEPYAIPALGGATIVAVAHALGSDSGAFALLGAAVCLTARLLGLRYGINVPTARPGPPADDPD